MMTSLRFVPKLTFVLLYWLCSGCWTICISMLQCLFLDQPTSLQKQFHMIL